MGYDFFSSGSSGTGKKKEYGPGLKGNIKVTFKKHKPSQRMFDNESKPGIVFWFMEPSSEKFCSAWAALPLKQGNRLSNLLIAMAGGELNEEVLKSSEKLNSFLDGCIGQQYMVNTEAKDTFSNIIWDSKHRPLIELIPASVIQHVGNVALDALGDDNIPDDIIPSGKDDSGAPF